jgi:putative endonuclease
MNLYYVYIIRCSDNSYHTGITDNLEKRILEHNHGENNNAYTQDKRPIKLVFYESFKNIDNAIEWEKKIKGWSRKKKECLINDNFEKLKEFSISKNEPHSSCKRPLETNQGNYTENE